MYSYIPHTDKDIRRMLKKAGLASLDDLFSDIPEKIRASAAADIAKGKSEQEVYALCRDTASRNRQLCCFAGAGFYDHYIPAAVGDILSRPGFYTAYTPYQAEISQGVLQAVFEFQTYICLLTGLDVSNASLYDGFTAGAEACSMAFQKKKQADTVLISETAHPYLYEVIKTYFSGLDVKIRKFTAKDGRTSADSLKKQLDESVAAVIVQTPNFYGIIEDLSGIAGLVHDNGSLLLLSANPLSLGVLKSPAEWGADIAFGEAQCFGLPMNFGGPGVGYLAARSEHMRRMPGRIAGQTIDRDGKKAYVLTLQAREQHIKRERASSNICTNQALAALSAASFLALCGETGLKELAQENIAGFDYFRRELCEKTPIREEYAGPYFNEGLFSVPHAEKFRDYMIEQGFMPGVQPAALDSAAIAGKADNDAVLFAVTEKRSRKEIDAFIGAAGSFYNENAV